MSSLCDGASGGFYRDTVEDHCSREEEEDSTKNKSRTVLWTYKLKGSEDVVQMLFTMSVIKDDKTEMAMSLNSVDPAFVSKTKLGEVQQPKVRFPIRGWMKDCTITLKDTGEDCCSFLFEGKVFEDTTSIAHIGDLSEARPRRGSRGNALTSRLLSSFSKRNLAPCNREAILSATEGMMSSLFKEHEESAILDKERLRSTMEEVGAGAAAAAELTGEERAVMEKAKKVLETKGWVYYAGAGTDPVRLSKRCDGADPIPWGKAEAVVHTSAKRLMAYLLNFDSIERMKEHRENHGNLPRCVHISGGGGGGGSNKTRHFFEVVKRPFKGRRFETRVVWNKEMRGGTIVYHFAWVSSRVCLRRIVFVTKLCAEGGFLYIVCYIVCYYIVCYVVCYVVCAASLALLARRSYTLLYALLRSLRSLAQTRQTRVDSRR